MAQGCSAEKEVLNSTKKLSIFVSTSNSFLNQFLICFLLSLHYNRKHQKSVECVPAQLHLGSSCPGWQLSQVAAVLGGSYPGGSYAGGDYPRWQLS